MTFEQKVATLDKQLEEVRVAVKKAIIAMNNVKYTMQRSVEEFVEPEPYIPKQGNSKPYDPTMFISDDEL